MAEAGTTRATTAVAALTAAAGITLGLYGIAQDDLAYALGGASLTTLTLTLLTLTAIRRWITDTQAERAQLAEAIRSATDERTRYIAVQASVEMERQRLSRDAAAERAQTAAILVAERAKMRDEFDDQRAQLVCDTLEEGVKLLQKHKAAEDTQHERARVIAFPRQETERARSRDVR